MLRISRLSIFLSYVLFSNLYAQNNGDYRSRGTGTWWGTAANWEVYDALTDTWSTATTAPGSNIAIEIQSGHTIVNANVNRTVTGNIITVFGTLHVDQGTLTIGSTSTVQVYGTLIQTANLNVNGDVFIKNNGFYQYNRTNTNGIPSMTWEDGSTCEITGTLGTTTADLPGLNQSFYHFKINANFGANQRAGGALQDIRGNFIVSNTGTSPREFQLGISQNYTLNIGGDLIFEGGILNIGTGFSGTRNVNIAGRYIQTGGTFRRSNGTASVNFTGANSEFNRTGGTLTTTSINFNVKDGAKLTLKTNFDIGNRPLVVEQNATLDCETYLLVGNSGTFTLNSGAALITANTQGIAQTGASGSIQVTGTRTFDSAANYTYNGSEGQLTGSGLPFEVSHLTIDNTSNDGVTLSSSATIVGGLNLFNGRLNTGNCNSNTTSATLLTIADNATVSGASAASYVNGVMRKLGDDAFVFPIGDTLEFAPLGISAPANASDEFGACYARSSAIAISSNLGSGIDHISACEHWNLNRHNGSSSVSVMLSWDTRSCGVTDPSELLVVRFNGTEWESLGNTATTGSNASGTINSGLVSSFSPFTLASSTANNPLPVELTSFNAQCLGSQVELTWSTASEFKASHYTVQMSRDGSTWSDLGEIEAAGTTSLTSHYHFNVANASTLSYFRLVQEDLDGTKAIFGPISTNCTLNNNLMTVFPNPANDQITINLQSIAQIDEARIQLLDMSGRVVMERRLDLPAGSTMLNMDVQHLQSGTYFVKLQEEQGRFETVRVVKM